MLSVSDLVSGMNKCVNSSSYPFWLALVRSQHEITLYCVLSTVVSLQLEAKRCFVKMQRELLLYERMKYTVSAKI